MASRELRIGDRVRVYGGYDHEPAWLAADPGGYRGVVVDFLVGGDSRPVPVVELDQELVLPEGAGATERPVRGRFLALELGHLNTDWSTPMPRLHIELFDSRPEADGSEGRPQGAWVESHATYEVVDGAR